MKNYVAEVGKARPVIKNRRKTKRTRAEKSAAYSLINLHFRDKIRNHISELAELMKKKNISNEDVSKIGFLRNAITQYRLMLLNAK